jgi:hypothetical protein
VPFLSKISFTAAAVASFVCCASCSSASREAASALATQGQNAATTYATSVNTTKAELDTYVEGQYLIAPLTDRAEPSASMLKSINDVQSALSLRAQMMVQLAETYGAFGDLANYDAAGQVNQAIVNLSGAVNAYGAAVSPGSTISGPAASIAGEAGGFLAAAEQSKRIRQASTLIRSRLTTIVPLLEKEKTTLKNVQDEIVDGSRDTELALWDKGFANPSPILGSQLGQLGLRFEQADYQHHFDALSNSDRANFRKAIGLVVRYRAQRQATLQAEILDQTIDGLSALIGEHKKLEQGEDLNLQALTVHVTQMRAFIDELNTSTQNGGCTKQ